MAPLREHVRESLDSGQNLLDHLPTMNGDPQPEFRKSLRHYNTPGHAHSLTFSCYRRQPFLARDRCREWLVEAIAEARESRQFDVWAYVFMPEHVHLLILPRLKVYDVAQILRSIKEPVARRAVAWVRRQAPDFLVRMHNGIRSGKPVYRFWQRGGGYDRNLVTPRAIWGEIRYIHDNPVRRDLVESPLDWPWSSARAYAELGRVPLSVDWANLPPEPRSRE